MKNLLKQIKTTLKPVLGPLFPRRFWMGYRAFQMRQLYRQARPISNQQERLLFWVPGGMPLMLHVEGAIAAALRLRGVKVHAIICDGAYRACIRREINDDVPVDRWQESCPRCTSEAAAVLKEFGIPYSFIGDFVPPSRRAELWEMAGSIGWENLDSLNYGKIKVGQNVHSAILRYLQGYPLNGHEGIIREYVYSGLICAAAAATALEGIAPARLFLSHGIYVDWGPALHTALSLGIPITAWLASYLSWRFYFRHVEDGVNIDFHSLSQTAWEACCQSPLTPVQNERLDQYLQNRYQKQISFDMKVLKQYTGQIIQLRQKFAPTDKPIWGIMTHINWDCVSDYSPMAYPSFDDWLLDTIREITSLPEVQWLIKIHPAEAWDNPASGAECLIRKNFPSLPDHIQVIPATEEISPLEFFQLIDGGVTVYGTSGLESALLGKPVILSGEAHYGGKGFTYDGLSPEAYKQLLRQAGSLPSLSDAQQQLVRRYAYCYFIQRQVPLPVVRDPKSSWWNFQFDQRNLLLPGKDPFIDFLCDRILDGQDFIMDESLVAQAQDF